MQHHRFLKPILAILLALAASDPSAQIHHWELPSRDPDRIVLTVPGSPATSAGFNWRTDITVESGMLEIAKETGAPRFDLDKEIYPATAETLKFEESRYNRAFSANYHSVVVTDLEPDTLYCYRVGDGDAYWSEWIQFRTTPSTEEPFSFLYYGDAQNAVLSHWSRVIRAAYATAPDAWFALHAGDLINRADRDVEWAGWFKAGGWIHAGTPVLPVTGNHEYTKRDDIKAVSLHWRPQFTLPVVDELPEQLAETVYTVEYPNLRIIVLNSNEDPNSQVDWLRATLEANTSRWVVVSFHHPLFSSGTGRDNKKLREAWKPIFDEFNVDLILQGHDHTYARGQSPQVPAARPENEEGAETVQCVYVNSVSGPKQYNFDPEGWDRFADSDVSLLRKAENTQFFQVIRIDGKQLEYKAYTAARVLYDGFTLYKDDDGAKTIEQMEDLPAERMFDNTDPFNMNGL